MASPAPSQPQSGAGSPGRSATAAPGTVSAQPGEPAAPGANDTLNARLKAGLPNGLVTYSTKHVEPDLDSVVASVKSEYAKEKLAPPASVLANALYRVARRRTLTHPGSVTYVLKKRKIFGFEICTGWQVIASPFGGGPPQSGYTIGPCSGDAFNPAWADELPTLAPMR